MVRSLADRTFQLRREPPRELGEGWITGGLHRFREPRPGQPEVVELEGGVLRGDAFEVAVPDRDDL